MSKPALANHVAIPGRVLVAEDDPEMRHVLVEALVLDGHEVYEVADGAALLIELARNTRFHFRAVDAVVADVRMPLCSGIQALETIRRLPLALPFVLLSAFADAEAHAKVTTLGGILLDKPVSMKKLCRVVSDQVAAGRRQRSSPSRSNIR